MKLIIQIPCYNEENHLPGTLADLPDEIDGIDVIERLIIDDGSTDETERIAKKLGVEHTVRFATNRGLAAAFRVGIQRCVELGADIIVNTDGDNQYRGADIEKIVRPIIEGKADLVIGDRQTWSHPEFGLIKKILQRLGSRLISYFARTPIPDATSGFRAFKRDAALQLNILSDYTYTHETSIQAGLHNLKVESVPIKINPKTRASRLFSSTFSYIWNSGINILRIYTLYRPLKIFTLMALVNFILGTGLGVRFLYYYFIDEGGGHVQSLIMSAILFNLSFVLFVVGVMSDLIGFNRRLLEEMVMRMRRMQGQLTSDEKTSSVPTQLSSDQTQEN